MMTRSKSSVAPNEPGRNRLGGLPTLIETAPLVGTDCWRYHFLINTRNQYAGPLGAKSDGLWRVCKRLPQIRLELDGLSLALLGDLPNRRVALCSCLVGPGDAEPT